MSFIYPRTITITRPSVTTELGAGPYSGQSKREEVLIADKVSASIQQKGGGGKPPSNLPGDTPSKTNWRVLIPLNELNQGVINTWDIVTDDLGVRYQVVAPYWNSLGYNLACQRLET